MKSATRIMTTGAIALSLSTAVAWAGMPQKTEVKKAAKQLESQNKSLADVIKAAEEKTGGTAVAVALDRAPSDRQDPNRPATANDGRQAQDHQGQNRGYDSSKQNKLEYRVTCLVDDNRLKDAYVCVDTMKVKTVRNANEHTRWTRNSRGHHRGGQMADRTGSEPVNNNDRYADHGGRFNAGPDGHYERIVVWHFVPNDGNNTNSDNRSASAQYNEDGTQIRTQYDPNPRNHHDPNADNRYAQGSNDQDRNYNNNPNSSNDYNNRNNPNDGRIDRSNLNRPGAMVLGSKILDASATNNQGQDLGDIDEVVIDPADGKVVYTAVEFGGVLGIGEKRFAVPCDEIQRVSQDKVYLNIDKSEFENNDGFKSKEWPKQADAKLASNSSQSHLTNAAQIQKLSEVMGKSLKTQQDESLGTIDDAVLDTSAGRVAYLIIDCAERDGKVAVPCSAIDIQNDQCVVNMTKDRFNQLSTFTDDNYPSWTNASWNEQTHSQFNVQPYWKTQASADSTNNSRMAG